MAEIYRDSTGKAVDIAIPGAVVSEVKFERNGEVVSTATSSPAPIPYKVTHLDGEFDAVWTYTLEGDEYTRRETYNVVTPLFVKSELIASDEVFASLTDEKVEELERLVRKIIEAFTGQTFGFREGSIKVYGNGDNVLLSDQRIISLDAGGYRVVNNGYGVEAISTWPGEIRVDSFEETEEYVSAVGVITTSAYPNIRVWRDNVPYKIFGKFGWQSVPDDVKQAALILAGMFSCDETTWRDRYIKSIRAADWRFDFGSGAYAGTGSLNADQLLAKYIVGRMAVI
jgi:hypothetical protein